MRKIYGLAGAIVGLGIFIGGSAVAGPTVSDEVVENIKNLATASEVIEAIKAQNAKNSNLSQDEIDRLDKDWRAQTNGGDTPLITATLGNSLSAYLKSVKEAAGGAYSEIFAMDMKGLNVGQSDVTSDYWQGDEAKWKKSYGAGSGSVFVDEVEFDESSQTYQSQVSVAVSDPATNTVIGAITVGVNVEN